MEKIIERNVPIAEENVTLSGQPATNMFEDWSENITETDLLHEEKDKGLSPKKNPKKLMKEMQIGKYTLLLMWFYLLIRKYLYISQYQHCY